MRILRLIVVARLVAPALMLGPALALRAADVTVVPAGVSAEAVKAFKRGLELHKAKQWPQAIKEYERALALGGRFPEAFNNLAYCYRRSSSSPPGRARISPPTRSSLFRRDLQPYPPSLDSRRQGTPPTDLAVECAAGPGRAGLRLGIHCDEAEAQRPAVRPLEVVDQGPVEVTAHVTAHPAGAPEFNQVVDEKAWPQGVVLIGTAVLRHIDRHAVLVRSQEHA